MPSRRDLRPEEDIGPVPLPFVLLVDVFDAGARMRFRLVGTHHVAFNGRDYTGRFFHDLYPPGPAFDYVAGLYAELVRCRRPLWTRNLSIHPLTGGPIEMRRLMLPLADDGRTVNMSLGVQLVDHGDPVDPPAVHPWHTARTVVERERRVL